MPAEIDLDSLIAAARDGTVPDAALLRAVVRYDAWQRLAEAPELLDRLDPDTVAVAALRARPDWTELPAPLVAVIAARHLLRTIPPPQRRAARELTMARHTGSAGRAGDPRADDRPVRWARMRPIPPHLVLTGHGAPVRALTVLPRSDGTSLLVSGGEDRTVRLWDPVTGTQCGESIREHAPVHAVVAVPVPDGSTLLAVAAGWTIRLWDPVTDALVGSLAGHRDRARAVTVLPLPGGHTALVSCGETTVHWWDPANGSEIRVSSARGHRLKNLVPWPLADGRLLLAGLDRHGLRCAWDAATGEEVDIGGDPDLAAEPGPPMVGHLPVPEQAAAVMSIALAGHPGWVNAIAAIPRPDGRVLLASAGSDATVRLWDAALGAAEAPEQTGPVTALTFLDHPGGAALAGAAGSDRATLWNADHGTEIGQVPTVDAEADRATVTALVAVPAPGAGTVLALGDESGTVRLCDPVTGTVVRRFDAGAGRWLTAVPLPDGGVRLATASRDEPVQLWDPATGEPVGAALPDSRGPAVPVAGRGGQVSIITGSHDLYLLRYDPATGSSTGPPLAWDSGGSVSTLAAVPMPDGHTILAAAATTTYGPTDPYGGTVLLRDDVLMWDPETGARVGASLADHTGPVPAMAAVNLPDGGTVLASGSNDGTVRLWDPITGACRAVLPLDVSVSALAVQGQRLAIGCALGVLVVDVATLVGSAATGEAEPGKAHVPGQVSPPAGTAIPAPASSAAEAVAGPYRQRWARIRPHPPHRVLTGHDGPVRLLAGLAPPAGPTLLASSTGDDRTVRLWDLATGAEYGRPLPQPDAVTALAALPLPDGVALLAVAAGAAVRLWEPVAGALAATLTGLPATVTALAAVYLPDGRVLLATGGAEPDPAVRLWDFLNGEEVAALAGHQRSLRKLVAWPGPAGQRRLVSLADSPDPTRVWDLGTYTEIGRVGVSEAATLEHPDGRTLLATVGLGSLTLWDPAGGRVAHASPGTATDDLLMAVPLPDRRPMLAGVEGNRIRLRNPLAGDPSVELTGHTDDIVALVAQPLPDGRVVLASGGADATIRLWDPTVRPAITAADTGPVPAVAFVPHPDGRTLLAVVSRRRRRVLLWEADTSEPAGELPQYGDFVDTAAAVPLPDGRTLVAVGGGEQLLGDIHEVWLYDPVARATIGRLSGHYYWVTDLVAFRLPDGRTALAVGCFTGEEPDPEDDPETREYAEQVRLWDPVTGTEIGPATEQFTGTLTAVPLPDGNTVLAAQTAGHALALWDPVTGAARGKPLVGHTAMVTTMAAVSRPDSRALLATGGDDRTVRLWDPVNGAAVGGPLTGHRQPISALAAVESPGEGTLLVSGSRDGTLRLWSPEDQTCRWVLPLGSPVLALATHGPRLAVGCESGVLVLDLTAAP